MTDLFAPPPDEFEAFWKAYPRRVAKLVARIEANSIPEPNTGCWLWLNATDAKGYGRVALTKATMEGLAHRLSFKAFNGGIDNELMVLHRCDQPSCVNPDHLFQGTAQENTDDMKRKGRARGKKGEDSTSVLTEETVRWLRSLYVPGHSEFGASALARKLGYGRNRRGCTINSTVHAAITGKTWGHVS